MFSGGIFDFEQKQERLTEVELELAESTVWEKPEYAQALGKERVSLQGVVNTILELEQSYALPPLKCFLPRPY